jgi:hypothetical protein
LGVQPQNAILVDTDVTRAGYTGDRVPDMQRRMIDAMKAIPGVTSVGLVGQYPPLHMGWNSTNVYTDQTTDMKPSNALSVANDGKGGRIPFKETTRHLTWEKLPNK